MTIKVSPNHPVFPALNPAQAEIRILEVQPGSPGSAVHCKFHVVTLDKLESPYETLSYTWGDENEATRVTIWLNEAPVAVARNLFDALQRLRMTHEPRYLWVDALCINQADDVEKTWQVSMMYRIYSQCQQCAIWLGVLGDVDVFHARAAVDALCWFAGSRRMPDWMDEDSTRDDAARAVKTFMNLPWWGRIWTVQEAILPSSATVYWGPCEIAWDLMRRAADSFFEGSPARDAPVPGEFGANGGAIDLQCAMRGLQFARHESLFEVLWRWRFRQATDPRDKVYGLVGFRRDTTLPTVKTCDYTIDVKTLFQRVTADLIRISTDLLPLIGRGGEVSDIPGLASWAVDWHGVRDDSRRSKVNFWDHHRRWFGLYFTADRGVRGVCESFKVEDDRILCLHGIQIDRICVVEDRSKGTCVQEYGSAGSFFLNSGGRWGRVITQFQEQYHGKLPENWMSAFLGLITGKLIPGEPNHGDGLDDWMQNMVRPQALFITDSGRFGLGPRNIRSGQEVWILGGSRFPLILNRGVEGIDDEGLTFAGECFVYGVMKGEAIEGRSSEQRVIKLY